MIMAKDSDGRKFNRIPEYDRVQNGKTIHVSAHVRSNRSDCKRSKEKMIATSLRIVPWRCESLWHFCMLDTDIMLANKSLAIFKPLAQSQKTMLTTNQRNFSTMLRFHLYSNM